jgi:transposase
MKKQIITPDEITQLNNEISKLTLENEALSAKVKFYEEQQRLAKLKRFGSSSEKINPNQLAIEGFFNEAEAFSLETSKEPDIIIKAHPRKKRKTQKELLDGLRVETVLHDISEEEKICKNCFSELHILKTEVSRELKVIPAEVIVIEHEYPTWVCRNCEITGTETTIIKATAPISAFPGTQATPSAVAYIMCQKYAEGMPLYRQEKYFEGLNVCLSRQTMSNWMLMGAEKWLLPIYNLLHFILIGLDVIHSDETTVKVLNEDGRTAQNKSYMWLFRSGNCHQPIVLFEYQPTRGAKHPILFLEGFEGYLQTDGYSGYESVPNATIIGCWAHARRKFVDALNSLPKDLRESPTAATLVKEGLSYCTKLFAIEKDLKELSYEEREISRIKRSKPVLDAFLVWLKLAENKTLKKSLLGNAITYCLNQWDKLIAFMLDGRLEIHNNLAESAIRPFVIGRKNWLFSITPRGATASSIIYSIVETAKANSLVPFKYIEFLFETLPQINTNNPEELIKFLPWGECVPSSFKVNKKN